MPAKARLDRPLPRSRRELCNRLRELRPKLFAEVIWRAVAVEILEHERVGERGGELGILGLAGESRQRCRRIVARMIAAAVWRKVQMAETYPAGLREHGFVLLEPALEFGRFRLARGGHILGKKL